jgi:hypothetical protein
MFGKRVTSDNETWQAIKHCEHLIERDIDQFLLIGRQLSRSCDLDSA